MDRLDEIIQALEETNEIGVAVGRNEALLIAQLLRAGQAAVTKLQDLLEGGDIAGASEKHYDKLSASVWKVIEAWDAALKGE